MLLRVEKWMRRLKKTTYVQAMTHPKPTDCNTPPARPSAPAADVSSIGFIAPLPRQNVTVIPHGNRKINLVVRQNHPAS